MSTATVITENSDKIPNVDRQEPCLKLHEIGLIVFAVASTVIGFLAGFHQGLFSHVSFTLPIAYGCGAADAAIALFFLGKLIHAVYNYQKEKSNKAIIVEGGNKESPEPIKDTEAINLQEHKQPEDQANAGAVTENNPPTKETVATPEEEKRVDTVIANSEKGGVENKKTRGAEIITAVMNEYDSTGWTTVNHPKIDDPVSWLPEPYIAGEFKICISVEPDQMDKAIPLVLNALLMEGAPTAIVAIQNKQELMKLHRNGKEFVIAFPRVEKNEEEGREVEAVLNQIHNSFIEQGIQPDNGFVLTTSTMDKEELWGYEREYLRTKRFVRQIAGSQFFYYGHDYRTRTGTLEDHNLEADRQARKRNVALLSEMETVLKEEPDFAHNPLHRNDPYKDISIFSKERYEKSRLLALARKSPQSPFADLPHEVVSLMQKIMWEMQDSAAKVS